MAVATFNTVNDGLKPNQKERGHYVVDVNLEDSGPWIPYAEGVWVQLCRLALNRHGSAHFFISPLMKARKSALTRSGSMIAIP